MPPECHLGTRAPAATAQVTQTWPLHHHSPSRSLMLRERSPPHIPDQHRPSLSPYSTLVHSQGPESWEAEIIPDYWATLSACLWSLCLQNEVVGSREPYSFPAQTKRFHRFGKLLILANSQCGPAHDSSKTLPRTTSPLPQPQVGAGKKSGHQDPLLPVCHWHFYPASKRPELCLEQLRGKSRPPGIPPARGNSSRSVWRKR